MSEENCKSDSNFLAFVREKELAESEGINTTGLDSVEKLRQAREAKKTSAA